MDEVRLGSVVRALRVRRRWRQADLATAAGVTRNDVSLLERGQSPRLPLWKILAICRALEIRLDLLPRWRGGDLDRVLNAKHAAMAESIAKAFGRLGDWIIRPEVSFSVYGERGVVDFAAWHPVRRALLLIELKTELVEIGDLMATADRRRRLAVRIGREQGWDPVIVGIWVAVLASSANTERIKRHRHVLRAAFPSGGRALAGWLHDPAGPIGILSLRVVPELRHASAGSAKRVRRPRSDRRATTGSGP